MCLYVNFAHLSQRTREFAANMCPSGCRVFVKAGAGANGFGKPSAGVILDKYFSL